MNIPFETFAGFLEWLFGPSIGGFAILMWFASWALEGVAWWHGLTSKARSLIIYVGSILMGVGAYLISLNEALILTIEPYFRIILSATVVWLSTQVAHKIDKRLSAVATLEIVNEEEEIEG